MEFSIKSFHQSEMDNSEVTGLIGECINEIYSTSEPERQRINVQSDIIYMCCPFCGDSKNPRKKRGLYWFNSKYMCFNGDCDANYSASFFLKGIMILAKKKPVFIRFSEAENNTPRKINIQKSIKTFIVPIIEPSILKTILPSLSDVLISKKMTYDLFQSDIDYLEQRKIGRYSHIYSSKSGINILNTIKLPDGDVRVLSINSRLRTPVNGYRYIVKEVVKEHTDLLDDVSYMKFISSMNGLFEATNYSPLRFTEGYFDRTFLPNSISFDGMKKMKSGLDFISLYSPSKGFIYQDNDIDGKKFALNYDGQYNRFLWNKFLKDSKIKTTPKDINELILTSDIDTSKLLDLKYHANDKLSMIWL